MGQDVHVRAANGGGVGAWSHRLDDGFAMDNDQRRAQFLCLPCQRRNALGRDVGQLDAGQENQWEIVLLLAGKAQQAGQ
jgi:hypothetical protein